MDVDRPLPRRLRGLTLVELMTTLAVAGISLAVLVPSWYGVAERSRVTSAANQLLSHLRFARSTAVARHSTVSVCPSDDGASCSGDPFGWQRGYLVFLDPDRDRQRDADERILRVAQRAPRNLALFSTAGRPAVRFDGSGAAWGTNTTFSICLGEDGTANRAVILHGTGRARVDRRRPDGSVVTCS
jgi:type IV fimbrial biogenesis protein FimT